MAPKGVNSTINDIAAKDTINYDYATVVDVSNLDLGDNIWEI